MKHFVTLGILLALGGTAAAQTPSPALDSGRVTFINENDWFSPDPTDKHYTQGFRASYLSPVLPGQEPWGFLGTTTTRRFEVFAGQDIFTPTKLRQVPPDPTDRPFAGWLYGGIGVFQESEGRVLERYGFTLGVVGPAARAEQVQRGFHSLFGSIGSDAWSYQIRNEPGVVLSYERRWRFDYPVTDALAFGIVPEVGVNVGNVDTHGRAGLLARFGHNIQADYGPTQIRSSSPGSTYFDVSRMTGPFGWYVFASVEGRAVARNIFLDGNTWESSASVPKNVLVADFSTGLSVFTSWAKLDLQLIQRTEEFKGQHGADRYGGISLTFAIP